MKSYKEEAQHLLEENVRLKDDIKIFREVIDKLLKDANNDFHEITELKHEILKLRITINDLKK